MRADKADYVRCESDGRHPLAGSRLVGRLYIVRCIGVAAGGVTVIPSPAPHSPRALLDPAGVAIAEIHALRALGLRIAVDDFGTGYSCLSHLNGLEIDRIKIDRSFVSRVDRQTDNDPVIDAIVAIAKAMKIEVIAEGVESDAQRDFLLSRGCTSAQGFLYGASVSASELLRDRPGNSGRHPLDDGLADLLSKLPARLA